jgi:hypothetical protein
LRQLLKPAKALNPKSTNQRIQKQLSAAAGSVSTNKTPTLPAAEKA